MNFILSASELHEKVQCFCKFQVSETCTHLVQATNVARDCGIGHAGVHHATTTPQQHQQKPQHTAIYLPTMANAPPSSPEGKQLRAATKADR